LCDLFSLLFILSYNELFDFSLRVIVDPTFERTWKGHELGTCEDGGGGLERGARTGTGNGSKIKLCCLERIVVVVVAVAVEFVIVSTVVVAGFVEEVVAVVGEAVVEAEWR
jgi:hypothetical protein